MLPPERQDAVLGCLSVQALSQPKTSNEMNMTQSLPQVLLLAILYTYMFLKVNKFLVSGLPLRIIMKIIFHRQEHYRLRNISAVERNRSKSHAVRLLFADN